MAISTQMLKGLMDGVILKVISKEETYGYEIYETLQIIGFSYFAEGSLYPLLLRLERKGLIKGVKKTSSTGPDRKYYYLTEEGKEEMDSFKETWDSFNVGVGVLWQDDIK